MTDVEAPQSPVFRVAPQEYCEDIAVEWLKPHPDNVNEGDVGAIAESMGEHGFYGGVIVQAATGFLIAGEHRYRSALALGGTTLPGFLLDVDDDEAPFRDVPRTCALPVAECDRFHTPREQRMTTARKTGLALLPLAFIVGAFLGLRTDDAFANTGAVTANESCDGWHATVSLANNVTADRTVTITSTIPGTPASTVLQQDTTQNPGAVLVWEYDGSETDRTGTVTMTITPDAFTNSASLVPAEGCEPPVVPPVEPPVVPPTPPVPVASCETDTALCIEPATPGQPPVVAEGLPVTGSGETIALGTIGSAMVAGGIVMSRRHRARRGLTVS